LTPLDWAAGIDQPERRELISKKGQLVQRAQYDWRQKNKGSGDLGHKLETRNFIFRVASSFKQRRDELSLTTSDISLAWVERIYFRETLVEEEELLLRFKQTCWQLVLKQRYRAAMDLRCE
jgi:hypothetical protein